MKPPIRCRVGARDIAGDMFEVARTLQLVLAAETKLRQAAS